MGGARAPVAGIDMSVRRIEEAERVAGLLIDALLCQGVGVDRIVVGIHRVVDEDTGGRGGWRFAFSVSVGEVCEERTWGYVRRATEAATECPGGLADPTVVLRERRIGPGQQAAGARAAAKAQANRSGGRAVAFPGRPRLVGTLQVRHILEISAIEDVLDITQTTPRPDDVVIVNAPVRPRWSFGRLVLYVLPAAGVPDSVYLPFTAQVLAGAPP